MALVEEEPPRQEGLGEEALCKCLHKPTPELLRETDLDVGEIAALVGKVLGKQISYTSQPIPDFRAQLENQHAPQHLVQHLCEVAQDYQDGIFAGTNDIIERVTGRPPLTVPEFVELHRAEFSA